MNWPIAVGIVALSLLLSACATQPAAVVADVPGFFSGVLHGFFAVFSLIGSIFWDIRVYSFPNSGFWYDFGFVLGVAAFFGGGVSQSM